MATKHKRQRIAKAIIIIIMIKEGKKCLRAAFATVGAANELDVAATVLVAASIPSLERLREHNKQKNR